MSDDQPGVSPATRFLEQQASRDATEALAFAKKHFERHDNDQPFSEFQGRRIEFGGRVVHATRLETNQAACGADLNAGYPEMPDTQITCRRCVSTLNR